MMKWIRKITGIVLLMGVLAAQPLINDLWPAEQTAREMNTGSQGLDINRVFTEAANVIMPSVVSIRCIKASRSEDYGDESDEDGQLNELLGESVTPNLLPDRFRHKGSGSGMIVSRAGHILTNVHVVEATESISVLLHDQKTYEATIVGIDQLTEIALIKIEADNLIPAQLGDSDQCRIGEWVMAVGDPLELNATITAGIISAKGREINIISDTYGVENFIQTDAAINPGNSGGPLINLKGEVIGITTAIATEDGYNQGYGFAIPINLAKEILDDLMRYGKVIRGYLGISMQDIDEKKARALGLKTPFGVFIDTVSENSPAFRAGLREKDVLVKIDETNVNRSNRVQNLILQRDPGEDIVMTVLRKNEIFKLRITLGERRSYTNTKNVIRPKVAHTYLGLSVTTNEKSYLENLNVKSARGLLVTAVRLYSPSFDAGIQAEDIILEIGDETIRSVEQFRSIISSLKPGDVIMMKMDRDHTIFHAFVEVPRN